MIGPWAILLTLPFAACGNSPAGAVDVVFGINVEGGVRVAVASGAAKTGAEGETVVVVQTARHPAVIRERIARQSMGGNPEGWVACPKPTLGETLTLRNPAGQRIDIRITGSRRGPATVTLRLHTSNGIGGIGCAP